MWFVLAVLETGGQSSWLHWDLTELGVPAVIMDAQRVKAALSCQMNKTYINHAEGLAQLARTGSYWKVSAKRSVSYSVKLCH
jgi:transposase